MSKDAAVCRVCISTSAWMLETCLVGSVSTGACLHVLRVRYLRVGLDSYFTLGNCTLLFAKPSLSNFDICFSEHFTTEGWQSCSVGSAPDQVRSILK